jgi:urease accessory protein
VGAYTNTQGLEAAVESRAIHDAASAERWNGDGMDLSLSGMEAPLFLRLSRAWKEGDGASVAGWNDEFIASREGAELRAETLQMGYSFRRLAHELAIPGSGALDAIDELAYPTAFAFAVAAWEIDPREALAAYLFAWAENQVLAALKSVPLGQTDGQRMLLSIAARIPASVEHAASLGDDELFNFAPGFALASSRHETQYSRIFRS